MLLSEQYPKVSRNWFKIENYLDGLHEFSFLVRDRDVLCEVVVLEGQVLHLATPRGRVEVLEEQNISEKGSLLPRL